MGYMMMFIPILKLVNSTSADDLYFRAYKKGFRKQELPPHVLDALKKSVLKRI